MIPTEVWVVVNADVNTGFVENKQAAFDLFADQNGKNNYIASTMFAYRGDYLAIREISLSYSLPESVAKMLKMQRAEVSITGQNLGYITGAKNVGSPEANPKDNGAVGQGYSLPRTILFGVNLTF